MKVTIELPDDFDLRKIKSLISTDKVGTLSINIDYDDPTAFELFKNITDGKKIEGFTEELWNQLFRPYYKHGYADAELNRLIQSLESINKHGSETDFSKFIDKLSEIYNNVKDSYDF